MGTPLLQIQTNNGNEVNIVGAKWGENGRFATSNQPEAVAYPDRR